MRVSGIRVLSLAPVATDTPMLATFMGKAAVDDEGRARYIATIPLGRLNTPDDLAKAAVHGREVAGRDHRVGVGSHLGKPLRLTAVAVDVAKGEQAHRA